MSLPESIHGHIDRGEVCGWLAYDSSGGEFVFANKSDAETFVGDPDDETVIHPLVMAATLIGARIELALCRERILELERTLANMKGD